MYFFKKHAAFAILLFIAAVPAFAQAQKHEIALGSAGTIEVINWAGRVAVQTHAVSETGSSGRLFAESSAAISESDIRIKKEDKRTTISVVAEDGKRIDLILNVPERSKLKIETRAGAIEVSGNFESIEASTQTGTIVTNIPTDDIKYQMQWTESRPRYLADFEVASFKERSGGRFEIKGKLADENPEKNQKAADNKNEGKSPGVEVAPTDVSLKFTTARGIVLLNVPPNEVVNDLRQRPLTKAAKAIIRSGDALLTEAIRRASPKYFGDYARTLPPLMLEPRFAAGSAKLAVPISDVKTAFVRVTDLRNRAIAGLGPQDFEVSENGRNREVLSVQQSKAPFNLVLLLDVSGSIENYVNFIRKAARAFVQTVGPEDKISIITFNEDVNVLTDFTKNKSELSESLDTFDAGGGTAYYDALAYTLSETLRPLRGERTAIVVLTDGDDNRSFLAFDSLAGSIQESGSLIYPLYVPSALIALAAQNPNADIDPMRKKYMSLTAKSSGEGEKLAKLSGGVYYPITEIKQIQEAYEDIVLQMRSAYMVKFRSDPSSGPNGVSPRLRIKAKPENTYTTVTAVVASGD